ncbi:ATP-binding cassette domain-containing protein [Bacillus toyonensis]|uniref:ATP-binding cassette domain-containing protein n=1 Tax=Bacillus toyonensis TaxID=155322 RepID=UPI0002796482|nr:ATP-binding cassette domain-containing protein [Bacillus toyonensis]EJQ72226.1 hypothetical protein IGK_05620 [Bacillus toyonensis]QWG98548.1 ATP-binding cassette domain-containing protein [Bacillus toyonensis]HDR7226163.1 ATP-binding cassette domain-containing protein [Bacillus toyonensis]HDR7839237.1 ATP-binding cassette domain-containing protein [Bacillus toyonensis]
MSNLNCAIQISNLTKIIDKKIIIENANLLINKGEICSLFGLNGIGKSVFLNCITGYMDFDYGEVKINGYDLSERTNIRKYSAFVSSDEYDYLNFLTPNEYYSFVISAFNLNIDQSHQKIEYLSRKLGTSSFSDELIRNLSFGTRKKVVLIGSLLYKPTILICDEIFEGLDQKSVQAVQDVFLEHAKSGCSVLFTTHLYDEALKISNKNYEIKNKQIIEITRDSKVKGEL